VAVKSDVKTGHDIAYVTRGHASGCAGAMAYYTRTGDPPGTWEGRGCAVLGVSGTVEAEVAERLYQDGMGPGGAARSCSCSPSRTRPGSRGSCRRWLQPVLTSSAIRRDTVRVLRGITAEPRLLDQAADKLHGFYRHVLVAWAAEERVMSPEHGRRLAGMLPDARLVEIPDSYALDQPTALARALSVLLSATVPPTAADGRHPLAASVA